MATYTVDWFTTLDGFGSGPEAYWGKDGPELREQRAQTYGDEDQTLVLGANTYRLVQRFAPAEDDPSHAPLNAAHPAPQGGVARLPALPRQHRDESGAPRIDLELVDSQVYDGRMQRLVYVPTVR